MSKYVKNFILCGDAEFHCLICKETFVNNADVDKHLRWEQHRKAVKVQNYMPKYRKNAIYKLSDYYYCKNCNHVIQDVGAINVHIESQTHIQNKSNPENVMKRIETKHESDNIVINNKVITKAHWNGIINKICVLCDIPVNNISNHIKNQDHIIRLIESKVNIAGDNFLYRKVREDFQCFTCNNIFSITLFDKHMEAHKNKEKKVLNSDDSINEDEEIATKIHVPFNDKTIHNEVYNKEYNLEYLNITDDTYFDIDPNNNRVSCKQCNVQLTTTYNSLSQHLYSHKIYKRESNIISAISEEIEKKYVFMLPNHGKNRSEAAMYGKQNYIKMNAVGSKGYCTLCDKCMSAHIDIFKSHVEGSNHLGHLELKGFVKPRTHVKKSYKTEILKNYLKNIMYSSEMEAFWINVEFVIDEYSFMMIKKIEHGPHFKKIKCFACDLTLPFHKEREHCLSKQHKTNFLNSKVLSMEKEFIREIQPRYYHCGLCNASLPFYETVEKHLESLNHKMQFVGHHIMRAIPSFIEMNGFEPEARSLTKNVDNDALYKQFFHAIF